MSQKFKLTDAVWHRVVQIVQEAMLLNQDCVELFRSIEVEEDESGNLTLTQDYLNNVEKMHEAWLEKAQSLQQQLDQNQKNEQYN